MLTATFRHCCTTQNRTDVIRATFQKASSFICAIVHVDEYSPRVLNSSNSPVKLRYISYRRMCDCLK